MKFTELKSQLGQDVEALQELLAIVDSFHRDALLPGDAFAKALDILEEDCEVANWDLEYTSWLSLLHVYVRRIAWNTGAQQPIHLIREIREGEEGNCYSILEQIQSSAPTQLVLLLETEIAQQIDLVLGEMGELLREYAADFRAVKRLEILSPQTGQEKKWLAQCIREVNPIFLQDHFRQRFHRWNAKFKEIWLRRWPQAFEAPLS
jgi:hypothetical protein